MRANTTVCGYIDQCCTPKKTGLSTYSDLAIDLIPSFLHPLCQSPPRGGLRAVATLARDVGGSHVLVVKCGHARFEELVAKSVAWLDHGVSGPGRKKLQGGVRLRHRLLTRSRLVDGVVIPHQQHVGLTEATERPHPASGAGSTHSAPTRRCNIRGRRP